MSKRVLKNILKNGNEYEVGNIKLYVITEDIVSVSTDATKGVSPYNTSYGYTNITIDEGAGIKWKEGAIYTFVVNTEMVVASANRNVRVRIGSGDYIPVMLTSSILAGNSYFTKANIRLYQYTTKYQSGGALHLFTDSNTTYSSMGQSIIDTGTSTGSYLISAVNLRYAIQTYSLPAGGQPGQMIMMTPNGAKWFDVASPTAISLDESSIQLNTAGATQQLTATVTPSTAVVTQVEWSSSDTTIATVSSSGLVTCVTPGNAIITASTVNGLTATCSVTKGDGWQPGPNCIAYYPLEDDFLDHVGNYDLTNNGLVLGTSADGYKGAELGSARYASNSSSNVLTTEQGNSKTFAFWTGCNSVITGSYSIACLLRYTSHDNSIGYTTHNLSGWGLGNLWIQVRGYGGTADPKDIVNLIDADHMHSYVIVTGPTQFTVYKDGVQVYTGASSYVPDTGRSGLMIGDNRANAGRYATGYIRQVVIDTSEWTAQDALDYHNGTA